MITISKRLKMVADFVPHFTAIADVGCDHGYLSIYLLENNKAEHVYAMDVNKGPLSRAETNIQRAGLADSIDTILSDGLKALEGMDLPDACVICGMGGPLGLRILYDSKGLVSQMKRVYVQLQSDIPLVRYQLNNWGFSIVNETICLDEGKYYFVIEAIPADSFKDVFIEDYNPEKITSWDDYCNLAKDVFDNMSVNELAGYIYSDYVMSNEPKLYKDYLRTELNRMLKVRKSLTNSDASIKAQRKLACLNKEIEIYESKQNK